MEEALNDPLDITKDPDLLKDLSKIDVLVCGGCHEVFHFVEEFQQHKSGDQCTNISVLKCENEEKSQIWGFTLWKIKQARSAKDEEGLTSWDIYQKWTKLNQIEKDLWISAGKTLQFTNKVATTKVKEVVVKEDKKIEKDPLAMDDVIENEVSTNDLIKSGILKAVKVPIQGSKKGVRTTKDNEKEEYNVEKIVGKRFNPRKRLWEYEVKWENYSEETWEPLAHLENCKALVHDFEEKLKAEKEKDKEKTATPGRGRGRPRLNPQSPGGVKIVQKKPIMPATTAVILTTPGGRPQRTSKQKALNQVKAWCGNISDEEGGVKRPYDDDAESDDSYEKRIKLEGESEDTEDDEPKIPVRKVAKIVHTYNNNGAAGRKLPDNVLIPDAKGIVRISQKQLPSLSSGVYIMSKSSGIIKLDSTASKIATSGGQAIVKVSPKIGQTQIKIIKKEDGSKRVVQVKGPEHNVVTTTTTTTTLPLLAPKLPKVVQQQVINKSPMVKKELEKVMKKVEAPKPQLPKQPQVQKPQPPKVVEKKEEPPKFTIGNDDDSDDGLPELEFPIDLPLPEPDSPPGDFILDPITGKVAGMEYPDPEPEPVIHEMKKETATESIDNIVKLAAADITEDDLKSDTEPVTSESTPTTDTPSLTVNAGQLVTTASTTTATTKEALYAVVTEVKPTQSILNAAISNSNILQKTLQSPKPKTQPRIINQTVARPRTTMSPLVRTSTPSVRPSPRPKAPSLPKPKFNIAPMAPVKNVYSSKSNNVTKKIGNTTVYKTKTSPQKPPPAVKRSPQKVPTAPKPVISMPSLEEEPVVLATPKLVTPEVPATVETDLSTFTLATGDRPMFITGDDGTVYQVAGQNEEGQTILLTQDSDGQQQCLLVTSEAIQEEVEQVENPAEVMMEVQEPAEMAEEQPLVAQFIRTEPLSPGGTHKVVVMLPDGDVMVTQVTPEEYASLELDK